jgi:hypothetical protein
MTSRKWLTGPNRSNACGTKTRQRPDTWGRLVESAVGVELLARHLTHNNRHPQIHYWNNGQKEVDYVLTTGQDLLALEVKSGQNPGHVSGLEAFARQFPEARPLIVGRGGVSWRLGCKEMDRFVPCDDGKRAR